MVRGTVMGGADTDTKGLKERAAVRVRRMSVDVCVL